MKKIFLLAIAVSLFNFATAQITLQVTVKGIKEIKGSVRVGLFNTEDDFLKKAVYGEVVKVNGSEATVVFKSLPAGEYGVSVIHDENENGELDSNMIGIPKEGFGFGNNAMGTFGPPSFKEAKIKVDADHATHQVQLRYM